MKLFAVALVLFIVMCNAEDLDYTPKHYTIVFYYVDPCWHISKAKDAHNSDYYYRDQMQSDCERIYANNWLKARDNVLSCAPLRTKKSVGSVATSILKTVATAGTNFLVNKFVENQMPRSQMLDMMSYGTDYDDVFDASINKLMGISSDAAYRHTQETTKHGHDYPRALWISTTLASEILANAANLDIIAHWCKMGQIATFELGELIGDAKLQKLDRKRTEVRSIVQGDHSESIVFHFLVHTEYKKLDPLPSNHSNQNSSIITENNFEKSHFWYYAVSGIIITFIYVSIVIFLVWHFCFNHVVEETREERTIAMEEIDETRKSSGNTNRSTQSILTIKGLKENLI